MSGLRQMPKLANPGRHWFRIQIAIGCGILGLCLLILAYRVHTQPYLFGESLGTQPSRYAKIWFDSRDALFGANLNDGSLKIERLSPKGPVEQWMFPLGESSSVYATSEDGTLAAWIERDGIAWRSRESSATSRAAIQGVLAISVLSDGSIAALLQNGIVRRWSGDVVSDQSIRQSTVLQAAASGDYLAVGTGESLALFRYRDGHWTSTETIQIPAGEYRPLIPAPGVMAILQGGLLRFAGQPRNTHGRVLSVGSHRGVILTTGEFERVWAVFGETEDHEDYDVVPVSPGSIVAVGNQRLATSGADGTVLWELHSEDRLSMTGRTVAWGALLSFIGSILSILGPFLLKRLLKLFWYLLGKRKKNRKSSDLLDVLLAPPPALIDALNQGKAVLWAGAGLSAQAGIADRNTFAGAMLSAAQTEKWITPDEAASLQKLLSRGEVEAAMDRLRKRAEAKMGPILQSMVPKYSALSRSHELAAQLPFSASVTTNYDDLLERMQVAWTANVRVPQSSGLDRTYGAPFLLKLYGDLRQPATLRYSRPQLEDSFPAEARLLLQQAGSQGSLVFLGCSLEGLLADLNALKLEEMKVSKHFAVVGTSNSDWRAIADELQSRFGVEVLACLEENIAEELPRFLDQLVRATVTAQRRRPVALEDPAIA